MTPTTPVLLLSVMVSKLEVAADENPQYAAALDSLRRHAIHTVDLMGMIDRGELDVCGDCGCTIEDGECVCEIPF